MLSLEQIKRLEDKVFKAVELIKALKEENTILKTKLETAESKAEELEQIISDYRSNQVEIEEGIVKAIKQLEEMESDNSDAVAAEETYSSPADNNSLFQNFNSSKPVISEPEDQIEDEASGQDVPDNQDNNTQLDIF